MQEIAEQRMERARGEASEYSERVILPRSTSECPGIKNSRIVVDFEGSIYPHTDRYIYIQQEAKPEHACGV